MHIDIKLKNYIHKSKLNNKTSPNQTLNYKHPKNVKAYKDLIMDKIKHPSTKNLPDTTRAKLQRNALTAKDLQIINELESIFHHIRINTKSKL